jgi:hypothetical protein
MTSEIPLPDVIKHAGEILAGHVRGRIVVSVR